MTSLRKILVFLLISIQGIVAAQSGFYPPPSSVMFHNDTMTICPPDSLPGPPVLLLGYNIYVDSIFYDNILDINPEDTIDFIFEIPGILPGAYEFCAKAFYNEWISDAACDTGQVIYGLELPFLEDWSSGSFEENFWFSTSGNWVIEEEDGNPPPAAEFMGNPGLTDYSFSLESYPLIGLGMLNGKIWLDYSIRLDAPQSTGTELLKVQVWNWANKQWNSVAEYRNDEGSFNWSSEHINIRSQTMNKVFRVRFLATGVTSDNINKWSFDNIQIYRRCDGIGDLQLEENLEYNQLDWWGYGGGCIDDWIHWDDGVNSGNSIGTGGTVEFDVAARWEFEQLGNYSGRPITDVAFFPAESAATYNIRIWTGDGPDTLLVDQPVISPVIGQWNYVTLQNPVIIVDSLDFWAGYHVNTTTGYPAGVDDGPAIDSYGNMMYFEGAWQTLLEISPDLDYNWNIACHVDDGLPPLSESWYYKVYRKTNNGEFELLGATSGWNFQDTAIVLDDFYCYAVTAVWIDDGDTCESQLEGTVCEELNIGVNNPEKEKPIRIYPNPAKNLLNIESEETIREVRMYNPLGEMVLKMEIGNSEGQIDVSRLKNGIYFVEVLTEKMNFTDKILIFR